MAKTRNVINMLIALDKMADNYHPNNSDANNLYCWGA